MVSCLDPEPVSVKSRPIQEVKPPTQGLLHKEILEPPRRLYSIALRT